MAETSFNAADIRRSAQALGALTANLGEFDRLKVHFPNAGRFTTAQWVERIVDDRRNGIVEHAFRLGVVLNRLKEGLGQLADELEANDQLNAKDIRKDLARIGQTINTQIRDGNIVAEREQHNFREGENAPVRNADDGDGYNDALRPPDEDDEDDEDDRPTSPNRDSSDNDNRGNNHRNDNNDRNDRNDRDTASGNNHRNPQENAENPYQGINYPYTTQQQ